MSHLLAIAVGPVQEFIAAARRTRDLWFGSYLLSEISKAVAKSIHDHKGALIFPHPEINLDPNPNVNVANIILAEIVSGNPKQMVSTAKAVAQNRWRKFADEALIEMSGIIRTDIWKDQVDDVIEFYAAWVQHVDPQNYKKDRAQVMRLLAGRKNCRDFEQSKLLDTGLPKSSLDGQRATVLVGPKGNEKPATYRNSWPKGIRRQLRMGSGEQLDVVGVVKRIGEGGKPYPSVSRIAADAWIRGIIERGGKAILDDLIKSCDSLSRGVVHRLEPAVFPKFEDFPFEGTTLFRTRHHEWWEESADGPEQSNQRQEPPTWYAAFDKQLTLVEKFASKAGLGKAPEPYLAVLVADGDRVGETISVLGSAEAHRELSRALAGFASEAAKIVTNHNGVLVYAGGDDVLAFLPIDKSLSCAEQLHDKFEKLLEDYKNKEGRSPTLSVGIGIGHFMENLEDLLQYGREAEKEAKKPDRNGLAVQLYKRGGAPIRVRAKWTDKPHARLSGYAQLLLSEAIPSKLPYDLRKLGELYKGWARNTEDEKRTLAEAMRKDVLRVIRDKQPRSGRQQMPKIEEALKTVNAVADLQRLTEELLVARQIATALRQAGKDLDRTTEEAL